MARYLDPKIIKISALTVAMLLSASSVKVQAQDMLVTINRDTLNCNLGKLNKDNQYPIEFIVDEDKGELLTGYIHMDSVLFFRKSMFRSLRDNRLRPWYSMVDLGLEAGVAHQFGAFRMEDDLTDKSPFATRTGWYVGADLTLYVTKPVGYGLKYNYRSLLDGDIIYHYVGPAMVIRRFTNKRSHLFFGLSAGLGYMEQKNAPVEYFLIRPKIELHASCLAGDVSVGYHLNLSRSVSARFKLSGIIGYPGFVKVLNSPVVNKGDKQVDIGLYGNNINSVNLTVGFTFHR